jgi:peptidyl-prolyl cis-trans isomerase SurA
MSEETKKQEEVPVTEETVAVEEVSETEEIVDVPKKRGSLLLTVGLLLMAGVIIAAAIIFGAGRGPSAGNVAAVVNGSEIDRATYETRLQQTREMYEAQMIDLSEEGLEDYISESVIQDLINELLLLKAAEDAGIVVSEADIEAEYSKIVSQFESQEAFETELTAHNMTEESLKKDIHDFLLTRAYITEYAAPEDLAVTDEEIQAAYDKFNEQIGGGAEEMSDVFKEQIKADLEQQKMQAVVMDLIEELRDSADIEIYI